MDGINPTSDDTVSGMLSRMSTTVQRLSQKFDATTQNREPSEPNTQDSKLRDEVKKMVNEMVARDIGDTHERLNQNENVTNMYFHWEDILNFEKCGLVEADFKAKVLELANDSKASKSEKKAYKQLASYVERCEKNTGTSPVLNDYEKEQLLEVAQHFTEWGYKPSLNALVKVAQPDYGLSGDDALAVLNALQSAVKGETGKGGCSQPTQLRLKDHHLKKVFRALEQGIFEGVSLRREKTVPYLCSCFTDFLRSNRMNDVEQKQLIEKGEKLMREMRRESINRKKMLRALTDRAQQQARIQREYESLIQEFDQSTKTAF